ncbi:hypothetical protein LSH36_60g05002 [Paralvinella palmiformis]|uniref:Reverse transcriptase domain-containing protein n=1 Tax=Paralvinella palmiformis TaxID=53620 RepID=A0AAD9K4N2_9ANNE|nr:hypothetical protein LSH36_60g05002 [Paralvinella palmiformis]
MQGYDDDDTQLYLPITGPKDCVYVREQCLRPKDCLSDIHTWMSANRLKLNTNKTEIMLFRTSQKLESVTITSLSVAGTRVHVTEGPITNFGIMFDSSLSMTAQVNKVVKT